MEVSKVMGGYPKTIQHLTILVLNWNNHGFVGDPWLKNSPSSAIPTAKPPRDADARSIAVPGWKPQLRCPGACLRASGDSLRHGPMDNHQICLGSCELDPASLGGFFQWDFFNGRIVCFFGRRVFHPRKETGAHECATRLDCKDVWESQPDFRWGPQALHPFRKRYTIL